MRQCSVSVRSLFVAVEMSASSPYEHAIKAIDEAHSNDPKIVTVNGEQVPYELHYARKMSEYLEKRQPHASETLQLAIRAQHFRRWEVPRDTYPMTKIGYHTWRTYLKQRQAQLVEQILDEARYSEKDRQRVGALIRKEGLKSDDQETQVLEGKCLDVVRVRTRSGATAVLTKCRRRLPRLLR